jgi:hypothetical protein
MPSNNWQEIRLLTHDRYRTFNGGMFKTALSKLIGKVETHIHRAKNTLSLSAKHVPVSHVDWYFEHFKAS